MALCGDSKASLVAEKAAVWSGKAEKCLQSRVGCCCVAPLPLWLFLLYWIVEVLIYFTCSQSFQAWALQYPNSPVTRMMLPPVEFVESLYVGRSSTFLQFREDYGDNFCAAGEVWLSSFADAASAITSPQDRTYQLGEHPLLYANLPDVQRSRNVFLLSLADEAAGGSGEHAAFRQCFIDHLLAHPDVQVRRLDSVASGLLDTLAADYAAGDGFFDSTSKGLLPFIVKYLHYVMFGIDPEDSSTQAVFMEFFSGQLPISHYLWPMGYILSYTDLIDQVSALYMESPAFANFTGGEAAYALMTPRELAALSASILRIAGVQGFYQTSKIVLGSFTLPVYPGSSSSFDQKTIWDSLDLSDTDEVQQYIMECTRLDAPVSVAHHVSLTEFTVEIDGSSYTYPKGTKIAIPIGLGNTDKKFWGEDAYIFNLSRPELMGNILSFNSKGSLHAGRECPGKELVMQTLTLMLQKLGLERRASR